MKKLFILSCLLLIANILSAQNVTITGTVTSADDGAAIPGANILIKGTTVGAITDLDGNYTLSNVPSESILVISYVGMASQEVTVGNQTQISVVLESDILGLEEVVVIGYGSAQAKDLTSPIVTIGAEEIVRIASTSAISAIQGEVPGVQVLDEGSPEDSPEVRIRGIASMQGASPLYVVDGMHFSDISFLNPNDIKEISILKDASAAAIYGVRAAGGVILVTTKSGSRTGGVTVQYTGYTGIETTNQLLEMCNGKEYSTMMIESGLPGSLQDAITEFGAAADQIPWTSHLTGADTMYSYPNNDVNYYDELMETGIIMNHNLSVRGGSENIDYRVSAGYYSAEGRLINDHKYERINVSSKINYQPYSWLEMGTNIIISHNKNKNDASVWAAMYNAVPILPLWEDNGDYGQRSKYGYLTGSGTAQPIVALDQADDYGDYSGGSRLMYSAHTEIDFFSNDMLKWRTQFTQELNFTDSRNYNPAYQSGFDFSRTESSLSKSHAKNNNMQIDNTLTFQNNFGNHGVSAMAGVSTRMQDRQSISGNADGVPWGDDGRTEFLYFDNGIADSQIASDGGSSSRGMSYIGRLMYNYAHKYLLNATFRADGTDKYTETWGYFPSVGVGWVFTEEAFMRNQGILDFGKIRASWGQLGNNNVPRESGSQSVSFQGSNTSRPYGHSYIYGGVLSQGYEASRDFNNLQWEVTTEINVGMDLGLINNKLSLEVDWYRKVTKDAAILTNGIMGGSVTPSLVRNAGEVLNTGFEFMAAYRGRAGDLGYRVSANITTLHNEVLKLNDEYIQEGRFARRIRTVVGEPLYSFWGREVIGIYQNQQEIDDHLYATAAVDKPSPGWFKFEDLDGNGIIEEADMQTLGANIPRIVYGGNIDLDYKGFDFGFKFYGLAGNKIQNGDFNLRSVRSHHTDQNFDKAMYENRWTGEGDNTEVVAGTNNYYPSAEAYTIGNSWNMYNMNSWLIESGSFLKINNITLGYTIRDVIPGSKTGSSIRIKISADNPYTLFKYNGFDPNVGGKGVDSNTYPLATNYILGVTITY